MGEAEVINRIVANAPSGINGDDAAVLTPSVPNSRVVATTDMLVHGRHFSADFTTPFDVGRKAVVQNYADVEAMGARPIAALLAVSAPPETPVAVIEEIARGVGATTERWATELVGGDLTGGETLTVSLTAIGSLGGNLEPLRLDRARPGQRVVAHGAIGYSAAGLALLQSGLPIPPELEPLVHAHQVGSEMCIRDRPDHDSDAIAGRYQPVIGRPCSRPTACQSRPASRCRPMAVGPHRRRRPRPRGHLRQVRTGGVSLNRRCDSPGGCTHRW
mgnify:CR=1 FL=1